MKKDGYSRLLLNVSKYILNSRFVLSALALVAVMSVVVVFPSQTDAAFGSTICTVEPTPTLCNTPSPTPSTSPSPAVSPSPSTEPSATPNPSTEPTPVVSPSPASTPSPTPSASPVTSPDPSASPNPSTDPSASPEVSSSPTPSPTASPTSSNPPSGNSNSNSGGSDGDSSGGSSGGSASPEFCAAATPTAVTNLRITNQGANSITLSWNAATPVSHYALIFTRLSDNEKYGAANIGNTTSYVISGISGQAQYTFEVFGVNNCQPGERASITSGTIAGPVLAARPTGNGGQVLGVSTEEQLTEDIVATASPVPSPTAKPNNPQVLGETIEICTHGTVVLPLVFLVGQAILLLATEYLYRTDASLLRYYLAGGAVLASIGLFYLLGGCNCDPASWQGMICQWYWLIALGAGLLARGIGLAVTQPKSKTKNSK